MMILMMAPISMFVPSTCPVPAAAAGVTHRTVRGSGAAGVAGEGEFRD
jgi:hypothetical protein